MNFLYPIYTEQTECQDCYKCVRHCPNKAIRVENGQATVIPELCILCGICVTNCPAKAKHVRVIYDESYTDMPVSCYYFTSTPSVIDIYDDGKFVCLVSDIGGPGIGSVVTYSIFGIRPAITLKV